MKVTYTRQQGLRISWEHLSAWYLLRMEVFPGWTRVLRLSLCHLMKKQNQINSCSVGYDLSISLRKVD